MSDTKNFPGYGALTKKGLEELKSSELVELYNKANPGDIIKMFHTKAVAVARVWETSGGSAGNGKAKTSRRVKSLNAKAKAGQAGFRPTSKAAKGEALLRRGALLEEVMKATGFSQGAARGLVKVLIERGWGVEHSPETGRIKIVGRD